MKIVITSDSHGLRDELMELKELHSDADLFIHCGDSELHKEDPAISGFHIVKGNCDYGNSFPEELVIAAGKDKIFVAHGHLHHVKINFMPLMYRAQETGANIVCFGHTHILGFEKIDNILFINPGSLRLPRGRKEKTYIVMETGEEESKKIIQVYELGKGKLFQEIF